MHLSQPPPSHPKGIVNYINALRHNCNVLAPGYRNVFPCRPLSSAEFMLKYECQFATQTARKILSVTPEIVKNYTAAANTNEIFGWRSSHFSGF